MLYVLQSSFILKFEPFNQHLPISPTPGPWQPPFCSMSSLFFLSSHLSDMTQLFHSVTSQRLGFCEASCLHRCSSCLVSLPTQNRHSFQRSCRPLTLQNLFCCRSHSSQFLSQISGEAIPPTTYLISFFSFPSDPSSLPKCVQTLREKENSERCIIFRQFLLGPYHVKSPENIKTQWPFCNQEGKLQEKENTCEFHHLGFSNNFRVEQGTQAFLEFLTRCFDTCKNHLLSHSLKSTSHVTGS